MPERSTDVLERLAELPTLAKPVVSPDGTRVALYYDVSGRNEVHVLDLATGELQQWSDGEVPRSATVSYVAWGPDGDRILFHRDGAGDEQYGVCALAADGTVEPLVQRDGKAMVLDVDGTSVLFRSTHGEGMNVYRYDVAADETTQLTSYDGAIWRATYSAAAGLAAYQANEPDGSDDDRDGDDNQDTDGNDVHVTNADGSGDRPLRIGAADADAKPVDWSGDGRRLLVADDTPGRWRGGVHDLESGEIDWYGDGRYDETPVAFLPADDRFVATRDRGPATVPVVYDVATGDAHELDVPEGVTPFGVIYSRSRVTAADGRLVFLHTTATRRARLLAYDLAADESEVLLAPEYGSFDPADFTDPEYVRFDSDGVPDTRQAAVDHDPYEELEIGALLYDPGRRPAPLVVNPHGGPRIRDAWSFDRFAQALVARGYAVLQVNYRGSTGRGRAFAEHLYDDWGGAEQGDVATGVEHVLSTCDWLDEDRVAVFGGSFGGYSAYWQLLQYPDLYDAGVALVGFTDLVDAHGTTMAQFRDFLETYLGTPDENPDLYEQRSPLTHAGNLDAPLLMLHGANDPRVPVSQARRFRDALEAAGYDEGEGGDFEYVEFDDEGHGSTDRDHRRRTFRLLDDFLARRLGTDGG